MSGKSGLGERGKDKISNTASELFRKTENGEMHNTAEAQNLDQAQPLVRKQFMLSFELSEKIREQCYRERRKEVDVMREALAEYYARREGK